MVRSCKHPILCVKIAHQAFHVGRIVHFWIHARPNSVDSTAFLPPKLAVRDSIKELARISLSIRPLIWDRRYLALSIFVIDRIHADEDELDGPLLAELLPALREDLTPMTADSAWTNKLWTVFLNATSAIKSEMPRDVMISGLHRARTKRRPSSMVIDRSACPRIRAINRSGGPSSCTLPHSSRKYTLYILFQRVKACSPMIARRHNR